LNDIERAISEISDIKSQLAASTRFRGYAPEAVATIGFISALLVLAQLTFPSVLAASDTQIALVWGGVLLINGCATTIEAVARSRRQHGPMAGAMLRGATLVTMPVTLIGIVIGAVVLLYAPDVTWLLPGIWQMHVGVVGFSSYSFLPHRIIWPALWYLLSGAVVLLFSAMNGSVSILLAGVPFVVGHFWIAWLLYKEGVSSS